MDWYYMKNGERVGPVQAENIRTQIQEGNLGPADLVWNSGMGEKWSPLKDVYIFAVNFQKDTPGSSQNFAKKLEERRQQEARDKATGSIKMAVGMLLLAAAIAGGIVWSKGKEARHRGITADFPLGKSATFDSFLLTTYKMDKGAPSRSDYAPAAVDLTGQRYAKPKAGGGEHVSDQGFITLYSKGDTIRQIYAEFPTAGQRGPLWINKSQTSIQMEALWQLMGAPTKRNMRFIKEAPAGLAEKYGLTRMPHAGTYDTFDGPTVSGIWVEYSDYCAESLVLLTVK